VALVDPSPVAGYSQRIRSLYAYWRGIHPPEGLPGRQHFDPVDIPDLLPFIWLLEIHRNPLRLRYRVAGTSIVEVLQRELTGRWVHEVFPHFLPGTELYEDYCELIARAVPIPRRGNPFLPHQADFTQRERLLLPLARDGRAVDMALGINVYFRANGQEVLK
jgi:hypothetical protein